MFVGLGCLVVGLMRLHPGLIVVAIIGSTIVERIRIASSNEFRLQAGVRIDTSNIIETALWATAICVASYALGRGARWLYDHRGAPPAPH